MGIPPIRNKNPPKDGANAGKGDVVVPPGGPQYSFGSRFDSDIRAKPHLKPKKVDGPGPGDYQLQGAIQCHSKNVGATWGHGERDWAYLPKDKDKGNRRPKDDFLYKKLAPTDAHQTPAEMPGYSFPRAERKETAPPKISKRSSDPQSFPPLPELPRGYAKRILGTKDPNAYKDNGVPGPGAYSADTYKASVPGFVIGPAGKRRDGKAGAPANGVGPHTYEPLYT